MIVKLIVGIIEILFTVVERIICHLTSLLTTLRVYLHQDYDYKRWLKRDLANCESILELGCGSNSPILQIGYGPKTDAIDIWPPYIFAHNQKKDYRNCTLCNIMDYQFSEKQYDAVVITDVMEHLDKDMVIGTGLFGKMELLAKKKVIIFAPNGYIDNDEVDGDPYQKHISAWQPSDYTSHGYKVKGATSIKWILGKAAMPKYHPYSIFAIIAMLSQPFIFNRPNIAWHSYAVKEVK
jgi:hypothetical protein